MTSKFYTGYRGLKMCSNCQQSTKQKPHFCRKFQRTCKIAGCHCGGISKLRIEQLKIW